MQAGGSEAAGLAIPVKISPLNFSVDQYVAIGSPLGLFLALRKVTFHEMVVVLLT